MPNVLGVCDLLFDFDFYRWVTVKEIVMHLREDFELWTLNIVKTMLDYEYFEVGLNTFCIVILLQAYGGHGVECGSLKVIGSHKLMEWHY